MHRTTIIVIKTLSGSPLSNPGDSLFSVIASQKKAKKQNNKGRAENRTQVAGILNVKSESGVITATLHTNLESTHALSGCREVTLTPTVRQRFYFI